MIQMPILVQSTVCVISECRDDNIRLIDGDILSRGRVETCFNNTWAVVCRDPLTNEEAAEVCSSLGYSRHGNNLCMQRYPCMPASIYVLKNFPLNANACLLGNHDQYIIMWECKGQLYQIEINLYLHNS